MTTETTSAPGSTGWRTVGLAAVVTLVCGGVLAVIAAATAGRAEVYGVLVGTALVVAVSAWGLVVVDVVTRRAPALSLMVALSTYALQVVAMAVVFVALNNAGALDSTLDRRWLGVAVVTGVMVWLAVQVPSVARRRIPVYDLASTGSK